ncbi:MAG: ComF family protein [Candidatus Omnitrophota bacterium]
MDLVYPPHCLLCRVPLFPSEPTEWLCPACRDLIRPNHPPYCLYCSMPLSSQQHHICARCRNNPPVFDQVWSALQYNDPLRHLLHAYKYGRNLAVGRFLRTELTEFIHTSRLPLKTFDVIIPVPLHPARMRERGFNQSLILAEHISRTSRIPVRTDLVKRVIHTPNQARLTPKQRWTNLRDAFRIIHKYIFINRNILIVDDVITTGATMSALAALLHQQGARRICGLTAAVAVKP